jgi:hypothetical protein
VNIQLNIPLLNRLMVVFFAATRETVDPFTVQLANAPYDPTTDPDPWFMTMNDALTCNELVGLNVSFTQIGKYPDCFPEKVIDPEM